MGGMTRDGPRRALVPLGCSDALDKISYDGAVVGGLSSLACDRLSHFWVRWC